jgi:hypothetical protein
LEKHSIESGGYYGQIWTKRDSISYFYDNVKDDFTFSNNRLFAKYTQYLVRKWDTAAIRSEEKVNSDAQHQNFIYASLIVKRGNSYSISTIKFREFFKRGIDDIADAVGTP